eukprot:6456784-Pyramimonas_sp.AAC.1
MASVSVDIRPKVSSSEGSYTKEEARLAAVERCDMTYAHTHASARLVISGWRTTAKLSGTMCRQAT